MTDLFHLASPKLGLQNWLALQQEKGTLEIPLPKTLRIIFSDSLYVSLFLDNSLTLALCGKKMIWNVLSKKEYESF